MTGKPLVLNLIQYLKANLPSLPVYSFDSNDKRKLPCLIVGYEANEQSHPGLFGHYTVSGFVAISINGREDKHNATADALALQVSNLLLDKDALNSALNWSENDARRAQNFHCNRLFVRGVDRENQDESTFVFIRFEAFTVARDRVN
jgi:hypothetical protein